eukprot:9704328-Alexandrium_andersonii.AAC.1
MIGQLGPPTFFVTLTCHELQPQILAACASAHLHATHLEHPNRDVNDILKKVDAAVDVLMNRKGLWEDMDALA